ncbi:unnamed protein product [Didymodactylos carnosus]|uniref:Uncharacterized protein n=1 Tax=Didymodactylos carnosus TaxID=1234261 RepID=A0A814PA89_9BILA|nr:unnamed protein product [Didymodactylos carnosus]CAF3868266.1 unnamed protein product [Didymodactylos carnosus]
MNSIYESEDCSFYRKKPIDANNQKQLRARLEAKSTEPRDRRRGRPVSERENFQVGHKQVVSHINVKRMQPVVAILLGPPVPRKDRDDTRERHCRAITGTRSEKRTEFA